MAVKYLKVTKIGNSTGNLLNNASHLLTNRWPQRETKSENKYLNEPVDGMCTAIWEKPERESPNVQMIDQRLSRESFVE